METICICRGWGCYHLIIDKGFLDQVTPDMGEAGKGTAAEKEGGVFASMAAVQTTQTLRFQNKIQPKSIPETRSPWRSTPSADVRQRPFSSSQLLGVPSSWPSLACSCIPPGLAYESPCPLHPRFPFSFPPKVSNRISLAWAGPELAKNTRLVLNS